MITNNDLELHCYLTLLYRVHLGNLNDFVNTSCVTNLTFITEAEDSPDGNSLNSLFLQNKSEF